MNDDSFLDDEGLLVLIGADVDCDKALRSPIQYLSVLEYGDGKDAERIEVCAGELT